MVPTSVLLEQFEQHRSRLTSIAVRMLGSRAEAEDAVQETWLRVSRAGDADIDNVPAWLTTITARVCLNILRSRATRREDPFGNVTIDPVTFGADPPAELSPEDATLLADDVSLALLIVLDTLGPAERLAFVLHDMFALSFDEFYAAVRDGDLDRVLALLDPNLELRSDGGQARPEVNAVVSGARRIAAHSVTSLDPTQPSNPCSPTAAPLCSSRSQTHVSL